MRTQREGIALDACNPDVTRSIMTRSTRLGTRPRWERIAHMLACNLDRVHAAISGAPVYDYEAQEWLEVDAEVTLDSILGTDDDIFPGREGYQ